MLLVEIGGTHTRCAVVQAARSPEHVRVFKNSGHPDLESVVAAYLDHIRIASPPCAALAAAAPVDTHPLHLTNIGWTLDLESMKRRFGWTRATVVNDFEALACAVPVLSPDEKSTIRDGEPARDAAVAVLGPGTGLGVSGLVPCRDEWYPISGEGGHVTLAAADDREMEVLQALRRKHGHVSAERVLSGPGLTTLYEVLAGAAPPASPLDVTRLADAGERAALETLELFFGFLATVSADLALTLGARGGVYLGGGILPAMHGRLQASGFADRFVEKGRFTDYLKRIPVYLIRAETPALRGLAVHPLVADSGRTGA